MNLCMLSSAEGKRGLPGIPCYGKSQIGGLQLNPLWTNWRITTKLWKKKVYIYILTLVPSTTLWKELDKYLETIYSIRKSLRPGVIFGCFSVATLRLDSRTHQRFSSSMVRCLKPGETWIDEVQPGKVNAGSLTFKLVALAISISQMNTAVYRPTEFKMATIYQRSQLSSIADSVTQCATQSCDLSQISDQQGGLAESFYKEGKRVMAFLTKPGSHKRLLRPSVPEPTMLSTFGSTCRSGGGIAYIGGDCGGACYMVSSSSL